MYIENNTSVMRDKAVINNAVNQEHQGTSDTKNEPLRRCAV